MIPNILLINGRLISGDSSWNEDIFICWKRSLKRLFNHLFCRQASQFPVSVLKEEGAKRCKITVKFPWPLYMRQTQNNSTICTSRRLFWLGPGSCMASAAAEFETKRLTKSDGRRSFSDSRLGWQKYQVPNQFVPVAKRSCYQNTVPGPQPVSGWYDEVVEGKTEEWKNYTGGEIFWSL